MRSVRAFARARRPRQVQRRRPCRRWAAARAAGAGLPWFRRGGNEGTRLLLAWSQAKVQEDREATRARGALRRGQCRVRMNVLCGKGCTRAGAECVSAQGMGALKRGAARPLQGSGEGAGVRQARLAGGARAQGEARHQRSPCSQHAPRLQSDVTSAHLFSLWLGDFRKYQKPRAAHARTGLDIAHKHTQNSNPRTLHPRQTSRSHTHTSRQNA